jgi:hypothetical protein
MQERGNQKPVFLTRFAVSIKFKALDGCSAKAL